MNIHYDIAALPRVEHEQRIANASRARLLKEAERLGRPQRQRWSLALRIGRAAPRRSAPAPVAPAPQPG